MTEAQMRELVSSTFVTAWAASQPDVPLALDNEILPSSDTFAALTIMLTGSEQMTQGARTTRRTKRSGWIQVKLWTPSNVGTRAAAQLGDAVRAIIEMVDMPSPVAGDEPVTTLAASSPQGATDGRWFMTLVRAPFWYVETK